MGIAHTKAVEQATPPASGAQVRGIAGDLRDLIDSSPGLVAYNLAYLALCWALALGGIALFWLVPNVLTFVLAFVLISSRHQALLNVEHEAIHGKFLPSRGVNELVGRYLAAAPAGSPYGASRARHLSHHRLLATAEDPDHDLHAAENLKSRRGLARHLIGGLLGGYAGMVLLGPPTKQTSDAGSKLHDLASLVVVQSLLWGGLTLLTAWWVYPVLWVAPLVTVTVLMHLVRSFVEHAVTDAELPAHDNRLISIRSNPLERGMVAPYNMNWHAEHHLMPSVPAPRLKQVHSRLAERGDLPPLLVRRSYRQALHHYVQSLTR